MEFGVVEGDIARVEHFRKIGTGELAAVDSYRDIPIFAYKGLHDHAATVMKERGLLVAGSKVLELACGAGAMSQRLSDHGLEVVALDALPGNFRASGANVSNVFADLNGHFEYGREAQFDLVVAMEIIEHLEAPRAFLRSCFACLKPGGALFLSMPNVDSSYAIASLAAKGVFARFDDDFLMNDGHIMPIGHHQFLAAAKDAGFNLEFESSCGSDEISFKTWPKFWLLFNLIKKLRGGSASEGAISEYILRVPV